MNTDNLQNNQNKMNNYNYPSAEKRYYSFKNLEKKYDIKLDADSYYIVRFDGKGMTRDYRGEHNTIHIPFFNTMKKTLEDFCSNKPAILFAYSFSDEISILIKGGANKKAITSRLEKILSLFASELSILFYKNSLKNQLELKRNSIFDARLLKIEKDNIIKYFSSRQAYAICRYISQLQKEYNINNELIDSKEIINELRQKNVFYFELSPEYRYGLIYSPEREIIPFEFSTHPHRLEEIIFQEIKKLN